MRGCRWSRTWCSLLGGCGLGGGRVLAAEGLVDVEQDLFLPLAELVVAEDRVDDLPAALRELEETGPGVELLGRDLQALRDLLQDVGARFAQASLDLREVRIR